MGRSETWEYPIYIFSTFVVVECRSLRAEAKRLVKLPYTLCQVTKTRHRGQIVTGQFRPHKVPRAGKLTGTEFKRAVTGD